MKKTGINLENVKQRNKASILRLLNKNGPMSRKDIAAEVGLTPASVTLLTNEMIETGYLREVGEVQEEKRAGRRKILVSIVYDWKCVLAINIEKRKTVVSLCTLDGTPLTAMTLKTETDVAPEVYLSTVAQEARNLLFDAGKGPGELLGAGVCLPGIANRMTGVSKAAYGVWDEPVPVAQLLSDALHCPVVLENNIRAFAEGELLYGLGRTCDDLFLLRWGPGVGSAIVIDKKIHDGLQHRAGEIGHCNIEPNGLPCRCGRTGCLETRVSTEALVEEVRGLFSKEQTPILFEQFEGDKDRLIEDALTGLLRGVSSAEELDPPVAEAVAHAVKMLARTFGNVATILAPEHVALFGSMFEGTFVREAFREACTSFDPSYDAPYIRLAETYDKLNYLGPAAVAIRTLFLEQPE